MTKQEYEVIVGGLLHDIGKVIYRSGDGRTHSKSGYDYLKEEIGIADSEVLHSVLYHHGSALKAAPIEKNSLAYITYIADNIASGADRRKREAEDYGFEMTLPLQPVFNILNENNEQRFYHPMLLEEKMNIPTQDKLPFGEGFYAKVKNMLGDALKGLEWSNEYVNSLLEALEMGLSFVPSSTAKDEIADISLFDHVKMTAAVSSCIYQYLSEQCIEDYRSELFEHAKEFYEKKAFLLYSIDLSGIQSFIYTIHSKDALRMLRSRSFYLEIMMENIVDSFLEELSLSRANLIYSGGGHSYILLPNTERVKAVVKQFGERLNQWFLDKFSIALFAASGYAEASANTLKNDPKNSYAELFRSVSTQLSERKMSRYRHEDILALNKKQHLSYDRECRVCRRLDNVNEDGLCDICSSLKETSVSILYAPFFVVLKEEEEGSLPLPDDSFLIAETEEQLRERMQKQPHSFVRAYAKNKFYSGLKIATKIWVGNYTKGQSFEELAKASEGIERLGVLRADVDNLGQAFVSGFRQEHNTLSRTATLSRQLSLFFKYYINALLAERKTVLLENRRNALPAAHNATIVYSGGDDVFIVGAWNEIVEIGMELQQAFSQFTQGTLSISAGIGLYPAGFPIHQMAVETGALEEDSKQRFGKAAVTILPDGETHADLRQADIQLSDGTYSWQDFCQKVVGEKLKLLIDYFGNTQDHGKAFLYHLLELIRGRNEKINFARYVYLLSRMEPGTDAADEEKALYQHFSRQMYEWMKSPEDCRQLKTAITIYAYFTREKEDADNGNQ